MAAGDDTTTDNQSQGSTRFHPASANVGLDLDSATSQIKPGELTWAMNAVVENYDGQKVNYTNEPSNSPCFTVPKGYQVIGRLPIIEDGMIILWLANPALGASEIGKVVNCVYSPIINADCLKLDVDHPVHKAVYRRDNCSLDIFWVEGKNRTRHLDLMDLPYTQDFIGSCDPQDSRDIDCNKLNVQPDFDIPQVEIDSVVSGGNTLAGTYQFSVQYANALHEPYTAFYSVTNPISLFDTTKITENFNYPVDKSIVINITNIDTTGLYDYLNLAVIETVNNISTAKLVGSYPITGPALKITYSGEVIGNLNVDDIIVKYEVYDTAADLTTSNDVLILDQLTPHERLSYQEIASKITLYWETWRIKGDKPYQKTKNIVERKSYMRDEVYAFEFVPLLDNGRQCDGFITVGREPLPLETAIVKNEDSGQEALPWWQVYNTGVTIGPDPDVKPADIAADDYEGPYQYGNFAYHESTELYPCNEIYGKLQNKPIRFHRFPDNSITPHFDNQGYIYPIGVRIEVQQVIDLINNSSLTPEQRARIQGFKIVRANRASHKSIIAKGILNNVLKYNIKGAIQGAGDEDPQETIQNMLDQAQEMMKSANEEIDDPDNPATQDVNIARVHTKKAQEIAKGDLSDKTTNDEFQKELTLATDSLETATNGKITGKARSYINSAKSMIDTAGKVAAQMVVLPPGEERVGGEEIPNPYEYYFPNYLFNDVRETGDSDNLLNNIIYDGSAKRRFAFHSPDTHFYQPFLGDKLKYEAVLHGMSSGHIVQVKNHSRYQFVNLEAYLVALAGGLIVGFASGTYGVSTNVFSGTAAFTAYNAMLSIIFKITPHRNYCYQYNATGLYTDIVPVPNEGFKQRNLDIAYYLVPGMFNVGDDLIVNNFQRESSVYLRTVNDLNYASDFADVPADISKTILPTNENTPGTIASVYASIKNSVPNQYGQLYSWTTIDTGYQQMIDTSRTGYLPAVFFGGDTFINRFSFKNKLPIFNDNRVAEKGTQPIDDADISYNEIPNVGKPKYWFSTDVSAKKGFFNIVFGVKATEFFMEDPHFFYDNGRIFLFVYGIPSFFVESDVNVDLRQAYNDREGDFYREGNFHTLVPNSIPDEWLQEYWVSINYDNTYWYNKTFSKQNKENFFSHLPPDWTVQDCIKQYPFRAIFSEKRSNNPSPSKRNNWLIYKPDSLFDFPQNHGRLISLDGINNAQVLARFENKTVLYNALLTIPTSAAEAYLGQTLFARNVPPLDFADTDLGYIGTQHKFFLKTEYGYIIADAMRGQVFILSGQQFEELTSQKYKCQQFFTHNLPFQILKYYPDINIDNNFDGIGLHGVYDGRFNRMIITKLDYELIDPVNRMFDGTFWRDTTAKQEIIDKRAAQGYTLSEESNGKLIFNKTLTNVTLPKNTDVYAFFDTSSMLPADGATAAAALQDWFSILKQENPLYEGSLYILPSGNEAYLKALGYVYHGNPPLSTVPEWMALRILPEGFGKPGWVPNRDIILLTFVDEAEPQYHTRFANDFTGQPTATYVSDYTALLSMMNNFAFFRGVLYPIVRMSVPHTQNNVLQMLAATEGTTLTAGQIAEFGITKIDVSAIETTNPYENYVLPDGSRMDPLKKLSFNGIYNKVSPASDVFNSDTFASELTGLLNLGASVGRTTTIVDELPIIRIGDPKYFRNKSWTISFDFENMRWISIHSYRPCWYAGNVNTFLQAETNDVFIHHVDFNHFNHFNGILSPYEIEYPVAFRYRDELLQSVQDYTKVLKYTDHQEFIETDSVYFDQAILHNNQQCSGIRKLSPKPKSMASYIKYPIYNPDNINILVSKTNNFYQFNTFWSVIRNIMDPIWKTSSNSPFKELNQANMNYNKLSYKKAPIVAKDVKVRLTLNTTDEYKLVSSFIVNETKENT